MGEIKKDFSELEVSNANCEIVNVAKSMLSKVEDHIDQETIIKVPFAKLLLLGSGVSEIVPAFRTVSQTTTLSSSGLYYLANEAVGDTLKKARNGNFWGAFKTTEGKSKFAQLKSAEPITANSKTVMPVNPATIMMAVALYDIEENLGEIKETQKQILNFMLNEKKSEIEADIETLINIIDKYKYNWNNEKYISNNYKMVLDVQRTARKNMRFYHNKISDLISSKHKVITSNQINNIYNKICELFDYYRMIFYTYSLASLLEIMLSGNFYEEYLFGVRNELNTLSLKYRATFNDASLYIEEVCGTSPQTKFLKGIGSVSEGLSDVIGSIPFVKETSVEKVLQNQGVNLKGKAKEKEVKVVKEFGHLSSPGILGITHQIDSFVSIFNKSSEIFFDDKNLYVTEKD